MDTLQEKYDDLLEQRGLAAQEEGYYRNLSWNNRAKNAAKLAAVGKRYNDLDAEITAMVAAHPELAVKRENEMAESADRAFNS